MKRLHVNSSLPRSGSELLQALLAQHPAIYTSATSPLLEYWYGAYSNFGLREVKSQDAEAMKRAFTGFCRQGAFGYYGALTDAPVVVDKSRGWLEYAELLWDVFPEAKIVCMVRDVDKIISSLERIYRANVGHPETRDLPKTAEGRAKYWASPGKMPLGLALERLHNRQSRGEDKRVLYVQYRDLTHEPVNIMRQVFSHLGLDAIDIDPKNVRKAVAEDDKHYGIFGKHQIRPVVEPRE